MQSEQQRGRQRERESHGKPTAIPYSSRRLPSGSEISSKEKEFKYLESEIAGQLKPSKRKSREDRYKDFLERKAREEVERGKIENVDIYKSMEPEIDLIDEDIEEYEKEYEQEEEIKEELEAEFQEIKQDIKRANNFAIDLLTDLIMNKAQKIVSESNIPVKIDRGLYGYPIGYDYDDIVNDVYHYILMVVCNFLNYDMSDDDVYKTLLNEFNEGGRFDAIIYIRRLSEIIAPICKYEDEDTISRRIMIELIEDFTQRKLPIRIKNLVSEEFENRITLSVNKEILIAELTKKFNGILNLVDPPTMDEAFENTWAYQWEKDKKRLGG